MPLLCVESNLEADGSVRGGRAAELWRCQEATSNVLLVPMAVSGSLSTRLVALRRACLRLLCQAVRG